jgi:hypothetical protein
MVCAAPVNGVLWEFQVEGPVQKAAIGLAKVCQILKRVKMAKFHCVVSCGDLNIKLINTIV